MTLSLTVCLTQLKTDGQRPNLNNPSHPETGSAALLNRAFQTSALVS